MSVEKHLGYATKEQIEKLLLPVADECCLNCKYFAKYEHATADEIDTEIVVELRGFCRRYPPVDNFEDGESSQPNTLYHWWCGEFVRASEDRGIDYLCYEQRKQA